MDSGESWGNNLVTITEVILLIIILIKIIKDFGLEDLGFNVVVRINRELCRGDEGRRTEVLQEQGAGLWVMA